MPEDVKQNLTAAEDCQSLSNELSDEEKISAAAKRVLERCREAFLELAKYDTTE